MQRAAGKGFTLIELLVVIAIIAVLAAILFPVFARARENARRASCQSNLKQIALGIIQYTQDYDEKFPGYFDGSGTNGAGASAEQVNGWSINIQPYLKSLQIYQCPSEPNGRSSDPFADAYTDYGYNLNLGWASSGSVAGAKKLSYLTQPSLTVLNFDHVDIGVGSSFKGAGDYSSGCDSDSTSAATCGAGAGKAIFKESIASLGGSAAQRHLEGQNFSFCDGHVKWYKGQSSTQSAAVYNFATSGSTSQSSPTFNPQP
jgi:prepilin-type N-terminal cleavage/methylation domain-containing protein/prepilin-type processing-associated H-X9-DG protein